jgi:hypothetical protein
VQLLENRRVLRLDIRPLRERICGAQDDRLLKRAQGHNFVFKIGTRPSGAKAQLNFGSKRSAESAAPPQIRSSAPSLSKTCAPVVFCMVASCGLRENSSERLCSFWKNARSFDLISVRFANGCAALRMTNY